MDLTILTPAAPKRKPRIKMIFERLALNAERNPDIKFEYIIVDDSLDAEYKALALGKWPFKVKYINLPLKEPYPNPSYMRNVGFRIAQGEIFTMIDADHWIHQDFIKGALEPYQVRPEGINLPPSVLNTGFMIDTSKGRNWPMHGININEEMIKNARIMPFDTGMRLAGINGPVECNKVWLAAYPGFVFLQLKGYDEHYTTGYSREDDDIYYRLKARLLCTTNEHFETFAGVHLWHPQAARNQIKNEMNKDYYNRVSSTDCERNQGHEWGKFVESSYSIIDGVVRNFKDHEFWIEDNMDIDSYIGKHIRPWKDFEELRGQFI